MASQTRQAIAEATERFGALGHRACDVVERSSSVADALSKEGKLVTGIMAAIVNGPMAETTGAGTAAWFEAAGEAGFTSAHALFSGNEAEAASYINWVMGPPTPMTGSVGAGLEDGIARTHALQGDAQRSVAIYLMAKAAANSAEGGVDASLEELRATWTGADGGEMWGASMAGSPLRGVLLDLARIEAAAIVSEVVALRRRRDLELGLATYSLAQTERFVEESRSEVGP